MKNFIRKNQNPPLIPPLKKGGTERRNFVRKKESFICEKCGEKVMGDGYTDHCPKCLWGKHVDEETPGDRASNCKGMMEPVGAEYKNGKFRINYKCEKCNHRLVVDAGKSDDRERLMELYVAGINR